MDNTVADGRFERGGLARQARDSGVLVCLSGFLLDMFVGVSVAFNDGLAYPILSIWVAKVGFSGMILGMASSFLGFFLDLRSRLEDAVVFLVFLLLTAWLLWVMWY